MTGDTSWTALTRFVEADGIRFAYPRWGEEWGLLVFMNYFSGNPDDWDPLVTDGFATDYDVILFNNAGAASSGGETPGTVSEMTRHAVAFCDALGLKEFHVVGFSLGGMIAQQLALDHPDRVKRIFCSQRSGLAGGAGAPQPVRARPAVPRSKPTATASRRAAPTTASTMHEIVSKRLTVRGFINYDFAGEYYPAFLR